jgi:phosphoribosylaminoimidazole (AIR) synthetase
MEVFNYGLGFYLLTEINQSIIVTENFQSYMLNV